MVSQKPKENRVPSMNHPNDNRLYVLVKNFQGVNEDVDVFGSEKAAQAAFRRYTGFAWSRDYVDPQSPHYSEAHSETKIFEVPFRKARHRA